MPHVSLGYVKKAAERNHAVSISLLCCKVSRQGVVQTALSVGSAEGDATQQTATRSQGECVGVGPSATEGDSKASEGKRGRIQNSQL
jgi:hypothetical protein